MGACAGHSLHMGTDCGAVRLLAGAAGIGHLGRASRAQPCDNALAVASSLVGAPGVENVYYPGLKDHPDHELARRQFGERFGSMVSFTLTGGTAAATAFIKAAEKIPFCPSLGELSTTLSHPESTSHRSLSAEERAAVGISGGTIRLSVGIESEGAVVAAVRQGLSGIK